MLRIARSVAFLLLSTAAAASAQGATQFRDTSMLKPPAGAKIAIVEFEDLECPACAHWSPIVKQAVAQYHVAYLRHDFPLNMHVWSKDAAINARWMQDNISPQLADEYRSAVFAAQQSISSKDDLGRFTAKFAQSHGHPLPFAVDPTGQFAKEVQADYVLGERMNLNHTPTIVVVTANHFQEILGSDASELYNALDAAVAQTKSAPAAAKPAAHKK